MFKIIVGLSAFLLASCAGFFSVKGIAILFSASFYSVICMASSLELAKLVTASYLYKNWNNINKIFKYYMLSATILLMIITSLGIFGFLSDAFQRNYSQYSLNLNKINSLKNQQSFTASQLDYNKNKLKDLIELQKTYQGSLDSAIKQDVTTTKTSEGFFSSAKTEKTVDKKLADSRDKIITGSQDNIKNLFNQISVVTQDVQNLDKRNTDTYQEILILESDNTKGEIGTFKFVAQAFNLNLETSVKIFILIIVIVFDPLAVLLVIAYNNLQSKTKVIGPTKEVITEKPVEKIVKIYQEYKRGTKKEHNPELADPNIKD